MQRKVYWNWFIPIVLGLMAAFMTWKGYDYRQTLREEAAYFCDPSVIANGFTPKVCRDSQASFGLWQLMPILPFGYMILLLVSRLPRLEMDGEGCMIAYHPFRKHHFAWSDVVAIETMRNLDSIADWEEKRSLLAWLGEVIILKDGRYLKLGGVFTFGPFSVVEEIRRAWRAAVAVQERQE